ncbi:hypothetical protein [Chamaesiphon minutus]|uniref:hypothetical protein n=1 Tax=Chamaesiphon minutus TaxID=1173032 RepID=UPI0012FC4133|nr:hypothetical protein [Chamaesiphon minutus]
MPNFCPKSLLRNYFTAQHSGERNLWQIDVAEHGSNDRTANIEIAADKSLHRLPFKHCGKPTGITSLPRCCSVA